MKGGDDYYAEFDALYQELGPGLIRYLRGQLQSSHRLAEDIAQDAFLILWRRWPDIRNHPSPAAYLYTVAKHIVWETATERSRLVLRDELPADWDDPSESHTVSLAVREAIGKLPPRQREAVLLHHFYDFKQNDAAKIMQITRGAVAALLSQARSRLAELLG